MSVSRLWTADQLLRLPDDDHKYELVQGELCWWPLTSMDHALASAEVVFALDCFVRNHGLGIVLGPNTGFLFGRDPDTVLAPDGSYIRGDRLSDDDHDRDDYLPIAPDLVVEIVSCWDRPGALAKKAAFYLDAGVRLVWVADPATKIVTVSAPDQPPLELRSGDILDGGNVLPAFRLPVADIFAWPVPRTPDS